MSRIVSSFHTSKENQQIEWRKENIHSSEWGFQNRKRYEYIIPKGIWKETIWEGIREELVDFITVNKIQHHTGTHNLLSSWVLCANLYFFTKINSSLKLLMKRFLQEKTKLEIKSIPRIELEFAAEAPLDPRTILGEQGGSRGSGQTSPDLAFEVETENGKGLILVESKFTEHSFYPCSARTKKDSKEKPANPNPERCIQKLGQYDYRKDCHQYVWGRKYWDHLTLTAQAEQSLNSCPAAKAGYQLFRQHSLASAIKKNSTYDVVISCVAFDGENLELQNCLGSTGIKNWCNEWEHIFNSDVLFKSWTHQEWVNFVRKNKINNDVDEWLEYVSKRYKY